MAQHYRSEVREEVVLIDEVRDGGTEGGGPHRFAVAARQQLRQQIGILRHCGRDHLA